jgi:signal transduction histidine kinase
MSSSLSSEMDVYVLAPFGKDATLIADVLRESGVRIRLATSPDEVAAAIAGAGAAIIAEEALSEKNILQLALNLRDQPAWSDFPIIVLTGGGMSTAATEVAVRARAPLGNVTLLERPLRAATLISAVRSAITARRRQYEIRDHLHERKLAEDALRSARDHLEAIVEERTSALRRLSIELLRVQDDERRRIARELHDSLGQYLAAAKIQLGTMALAKNGKTRKLGKESLEEVQNILDRAIAETRTLSHLLHPPLLDAAGFASAASWYVEGFGNRSGIETSLTLPEDLGRLSTPVETALFRIMQEALTNVHRHSGSKRVDVTLTRTESLVALIIRDFGKGINTDTLEQFKQSGTKVGVGLAGIRERLKELGGTFEIESSPGAGTTLTASIPISEQSRAFFATAPASQIYSSLAS